MHPTLNAIFHDCTTPTMKLAGLILCVFFKSSESYNPEAFDYILRSIEYEASIESGLFQCVFYDISPRDPFRNILGDVLNSPALENTLKYVVTNGSFENQLAKLPWNPSMMLWYPGKDDDHLLLESTLLNIAFILESFNPITKVMVIFDLRNRELVTTIFWLVEHIKYNSLVLFDQETMFTALFNTVWKIGSVKPPAPMYLFPRLRRRMTGRNITYLLFAPRQMVDFRFFKDIRWFQETARYLNTEVSEYQHGCFGLENMEALHKCLENKTNEVEQVDITVAFVKLYEDIPRSFQTLFTTMVIVAKIAVPRERPLNAFELMLMPFSWEVWMLLLAIFIVSEAVAQIFPNSFQNDPILLAICGFERYDLHQARQSEKFVLLSLIVLMFFMSNAFETKIVSLMIDKPSVHQIRTLDDLAQSNIRFSGNLENDPNFAKESRIGHMIVNGKHYFIRDKVPGFGLYLLREQAEVLEFTAFDFERMQPWYVLLDNEFYIGPQMFKLSWRNLNLEAFRHVQITLTEAGLTDLWIRQWQYEVRPFHGGRRLLVEDRDVLNFDDMKLAWGVLAIGFGISASILLGEIIRKQFGLFWKKFVRAELREY